jgi:hypothetical protein
MKVMSEKNREEEVTTFWLRDSNKNRVSKKDDRIGSGAPVTLVAYTCKGTDIVYAMSTHNPSDVFNRTNAHNKALGRLKGTSTNVMIELKPDLGPEASIAFDIMAAAKEAYGHAACARLSFQAAYASYDDLVARHKRRLMKKNAAK